MLISGLLSYVDKPNLCSIFILMAVILLQNLECQVNIQFHRSVIQFYCNCLSSDSVFSLQTPNGAIHFFPTTVVQLSG